MSRIKTTLKPSVFLLSLLAFLIFTISSFSQIREVSFENRIIQSQHIIEGKIVNKKSFWDHQKHNIYTTNEVVVYKVFKGSITTNTVEIITLGGTVGFEKEVVEPSLNLSVNDTGIFILNNNNISLESLKGLPQFKPYASIQSFIKYDLNKNTASGVFDRFTNIENGLYKAITQITNTGYNEKQKFNTTKKADLSNKLAAVITDFSPTTASAGTETTITINGSGFGASAGTVRFSNADDGGATFKDGLATEIISWSDTQIVVEVYQDAGTGPIQVVGTSTTTSAQTLTVTYAELNPEFDPGTGTETYLPRHINRNGNGGYIWQMFTDFDANTAANEAFVRSLETWRCTSGINWEIGSVTTTDVIANDDINIVRHDNGGELNAGVLGRCTTRWSGCSSGGVISWYVEETDIVFDDGTNWNYSTGSPGITEYDFESVSVHELGHGHQLGHVIDTNDLMHYAISSGEENRSPSVNNIAGAVDVQSRSVGGAVCGQSVMISAFEDASFTYPSTIYSINDADPSPTITGDTGGTFTSTPAGLVIDENTGVIDVSTSSILNYTVTYTTGGVCPASADFSITITTPEIDVLGNGISITNGDTSPDLTDDTQFGSTYFGNYIEKTFTIENTGDVDLILSGVPLVSVTGSTDFTVTVDPVSPVTFGGGTTTFTVRYTPSMAGTVNTATLSIDNDDSNENPYTFDVQGTSLAPILVSPKTFLQGALITSGTAIMDDSLRAGGLIPLTTPYTDALTTTAPVLSVTGNDAIIDWIWVELRDKTDNTSIIASTSALIQADGDIVTSDGINPVAFNLPSDDYFIVINHRNHLGIMTLATVNLTTITTTVDYSTSDTFTLGGINAVINTNGVFAMITGDYDGDGQVLNIDIQAVIPLAGLPGYSPADADMNGQILNTDIQNAIRPNAGKGQQF